MSLPMISNSLLGKGGLFSPEKSINTKAWWNARTTSKMTRSGNNITAWNDEINNLATTINNGTPVYNSTGLNGFPAYTAGGPTFSISPVPSVIPVGTDTLTVITIVKQEAPNGNAFCLYSAGSSTVKRLYKKADNENLEFLLNGTQGNEQYVGDAVTGAYEILASTFSATGVKHRKNGVNKGTGTFVSSVPNTTLVLFGNNINTNPWYGFCSDIIFIDTADLTVIQKCEGYLANVNNLKSILDASHPYKVNAPYA